MNGWRPIATLPANVEVLVAYRPLGLSWQFQIDERDDSGQWMICDDDEDVVYWMPIPTLPVNA